MLQNNYLDMYKAEAQRIQNEYQQNMNQLQQSIRQYQGGMNNPNFWSQQVQPMLNPQQQQMQQQPVQQQTQQEQVPPEIPIPVRQLAATAELKPLLEDIKILLGDIKTSLGKEVQADIAEPEPQKEQPKTKITEKK